MKEFPDVKREARVFTHVFGDKGCPETEIRSRKNRSTKDAINYYFDRAVMRKIA